MGRPWTLQCLANPRNASKKMMDMELEKTVEPISFTQGKELKLLSVTDLVR